MHSRHNSSYWHGIPYLGCGPSAHSFDTCTREWNTASLEEYLASLESGQRTFEREALNLPTRYNEYIMTALRTMQGISLTEIEEKFGQQLYQYFLKIATPYLKEGLLKRLTTGFPLHGKVSLYPMESSVICFR